MKMYITFGQAHCHKINGKVLDADSVAAISTPTYEEGRTTAFDLFGRKFCTTYSDADKDFVKDIPKYYPRGIIDIT